MVLDAITNPTNPMHKEAIMWNDLSPVASECLHSRINLRFRLEWAKTHLVTTNATKVANTQGGAQSRRVIVRLYPRVAVSVGKNALKEREVMMQAILHAINELGAL